MCHNFFEILPPPALVVVRVRVRDLAGAYMTSIK